MREDDEMKCVTQPFSNASRWADFGKQSIDVIIYQYAHICLYMLIIASEFELHAALITELLLNMLMHMHIFNTRTAGMLIPSWEFI